jgi:hypothetical protein
MGRFNLEDYSPVEERIGLFYQDFPNGRILTDIVSLNPPLCVVKATIYRDDQDIPWASGLAYEKEGEGHVNQTSYVENCETSAIGRALANAGYHGKRDGAPRPSREEMAKVARMGSTAASAVQRPASDGFDLDTVAPGKKANGRTWRQLIQEDRGFVEWAIEKMDRLDTNAKDALRAALHASSGHAATSAILLQNQVNRAANLNAITSEQAARIEAQIQEGDHDAMRIATDWLATQMAKLEGR